MGIVFGIVGFILALGIVIFLFKLVFHIILFVIGLIIQILSFAFSMIRFLVKPVLYLGFIYGGYALFGVLGAFTATAILVGVYIFNKGKEIPLNNQVKNYFYRYEMAEISDVFEEIKGNHSEREVRNVIEELINENRIEVVDFGSGNILYKWKENKHYPNGIVTEHIYVD